MGREDVSGRSVIEPAACKPPGARLPTRRAIELAAAELFKRDGFAATTVRAIAAEAGVNPALVIRHFGSKEALFLDVMTLNGPGPGPGAAGTGAAGTLDATETGAVPEGPVGGLERATGLSAAFKGPTHELGRALAAYVVAEATVQHSQAREVYMALVRASDIPEVRGRLREVVDQQLVVPMARRLSGPRSRMRAGLVAVALSGLMSAVWGTEDELVQATGQDDLVDLYGKALQSIIDAAD